MSRRYITTAIDYPNAAPHMGHVLEKVLADIIARWFRLRGDDVRFQIGTDEHGVKIQQTADKEKITPKQLVDRNVPLFEDLYRRLNICSDVFIRTTDQKRHWPTVIELWKKLQKAGVLEKRTYTGLYCSGCERFLTKRDLENGVCPIHKKPPEEVKEENWFFLLSKDQDWLKKLLKTEYKIIPEFRAPETLTLLDGGLEDVSFSRPKSSLSWGIPVPDDPEQVMYVWCDALTNYISGLGFFTNHEERQFWDDAEVTHVIGKDIARFHALIWPSMLKHAGVRTPDRLLIHGFLTSEGEKMSKSLGNVVAPDEAIGKYGVDALRFFLSHEIPVGNDGDFSWKRFGELYDAKLRNQLGNLLNRVLVLLKKEGGAVAVPESAEDAQRAADGWKEFEKKMNAFDVHAGIQQAFDLISALNMGFDHAKPWTLKGQERLEILSRFAESIRHAALLLLPFIPDAAHKISEQLNVPYAKDMLKKDFVISDELKKWGSDIMVPGGQPGNTSGPADYYPSVTTVSGIDRPVGRVRFGLEGDHDYPADLDLLLVGPDGATGVVVMSDVGGSIPAGPLVLDIEDSASEPIPLTTPVFDGRYRPTNYDDGLPDVFPAPAPAPSATSLSAFTQIDPNGPWSLYAMDDKPFHTGFFHWCLQFTLLTGVPEVKNLRWSGTTGTQLGWEPEPEALAYSVYRGVRADLPNLLNTNPDSCRRTTLSATTATGLTENPPAGSFYWYLVRGSNNEGLGPAGFALQGSVSLAEEQNETGVCPP